MSDGFVAEFLKSGKALISDTKTPKVKSESVKATKPEQKALVVDSDAHKVLIRRAVTDKMKKSDLVEEFKKFILAAEAEL